MQCQVGIAALLQRTHVAGDLVVLLSHLADRRLPLLGLLGQPAERDLEVERLNTGKAKWSDKREMLGAIWKKGRRQALKDYALFQLLAGPGAIVATMLYVQRIHGAANVLALALAILEEKLDWFERLVKAPAWAYGAAMALLLVGIELIDVTEVAVPFVYFQF